MSIVHPSWRRRTIGVDYPVTSSPVLNGALAAGLRRWRTGGSLVGSLAATLLVVVGCNSVTGGAAVVDTQAAPAYRTSVELSVSESAATSSQRESKRQQSMTTQAVHNSCDALSTSSVDAITAVNAYVSAYNSGAGDVAAKEGPAIDSLNKSADLVSSSLSNMLSAQLRDALSGWVNSARAVANAIKSHFTPEAFNNEITKLNDAKKTAIDLCDAAY
jgi:hypothetical protein